MAVNDLLKSLDFGRPPADRLPLFEPRPSARDVGAAPSDYQQRLNEALTTPRRETTSRRDTTPPPSARRSEPPARDTSPPTPAEDRTPPPEAESPTAARDSEPTERAPAPEPARSAPQNRSEADSSREPTPADDQPSVVEALVPVLPAMKPEIPATVPVDDERSSLPPLPNSAGERAQTPMAPAGLAKLLNELPESSTLPLEAGSTESSDAALIPPASLFATPAPAAPKIDVTALQAPPAVVAPPAAVIDPVAVESTVVEDAVEVAELVARPTDAEAVTSETTLPELVPGQPAVEEGKVETMPTMVTPAPAKPETSQVTAASATPDEPAQPPLGSLPAAVKAVELPQQQPTAPAVNEGKAKTSAGAAEKPDAQSAGSSSASETPANTDSDLGTAPQGPVPPNAGTGARRQPFEPVTPSLSPATSAAEPAASPTAPAAAAPATDDSKHQPAEAEPAAPAALPNLNAFAPLASEKGPAIVVDSAPATSGDEPAAATVPLTARTQPGTETAKPVSPATPHAHVDRQEFLERVTAAVRQSHQEDRSLRVRLNPPELGSLQIEVSARGGMISARLEVQNASAQQTLLESMSQLREALVQHGTPVDRIDVQLTPRQAEDGQGDSQPRREQQQQRQSGEQSSSRERSQQESEQSSDEPPNRQRTPHRSNDLDELDIEI